MVDAPAEHLAEIRRLLRIHVPGCEVRIFGSRIAGTAKPYSDLDITLVSPARIETRRLNALREALAESRIPFRVDVSDWNELSGEFKALVERRFEVLDVQG